MPPHVCTRLLSTYSSKFSLSRMDTLLAPYSSSLTGSLPPRAGCCVACAVLVEQGTKFTSWQDVFPDVEARGGSEGVAAEPTGGLLETDSDDSDDESFKVRADRQYALTQRWERVHRCLVLSPAMSYLLAGLRPRRL